MYDHTSSVFNNSCLKVPKNPKTNKPLPIYEQKYLNQLQNEATKLNLENSPTMKTKKSPSLEKDSFADFCDSIPEYHEVSHLSNKEFYKHIENLKEKQKIYQERLENDNDMKDLEWIEEYKNLNIGNRKLNAEKKPKPSIKPFCTTPILNKSNKSIHKKSDDVECFSPSDKELVSYKPPSRRSVRIETPSEKLLSINNSPEPTQSRPKSRINLSSASSKGGNNEWEDSSTDDYHLDLDGNTPVPETKNSNTPNSLSVKCKNENADWKNDVTIPKPFQMTVRDEENKIVEDLYLKVKKTTDDKPDVFKAHDIPIESQIPLFDKIMADQEKKNFMVREQRKADLQAQMRPFSFTKRDEEIQALTKRLSKSSPSLYSDDIPKKIKQFKAKPIPKNLFSNYIYQKMFEDEFYRELQRKIRSEEMLKAASLPPSMAKREKNKRNYDVCPRSFRSLCREEKELTRKSRRLPRKYYYDYDKELEELENEYLSTNFYKFKTMKKGGRKARNSSANSSNYRTPSSLEQTPVNRSNLAAVLRIQSARRRLEMEMSKKLEEAKFKEELRWREKLFRKKPVWLSLAYSHEEDLAMRLQLRREEERMRNEEHRFRMQQMLGRVNKQPTLFERQSNIKIPNGTKDDWIDKYYKDFEDIQKINSRRKSFSDMSDFKSMMKLKDEAVQTISSDEQARKGDSTDSKESFDDTKAKSDENSSEND